MHTTKDILISLMPDFQVQVHKRWAKLTDADISRLSGKIEQLVEILQQRCGYGKVQAEIEIRNWLDSQNQQTLML